MALVAIPKTAEYAVKILVCLAVSAGRAVSAGEVARCVRMSPSQAAKTLHWLRWAGLTRSRRGPNGGYSLRQSPEDIRVGQVIQLFQLAPDEDNNLSPDPLHQILSEASAQTQQEWGQLSIAELARRTAGQWNCPAAGANENLLHEN
jgi:Rrf2 family protein